MILTTARGRSRALVTTIALIFALAAPVTAKAETRIEDRGAVGGFFRLFVDGPRDLGVNTETRKLVQVRTGAQPGTILIDTGRRYLYLIQPDGMAIRYGIGVGRESFDWKGTEKITRKAEWPDWRPPADMRRRQPYLPAFVPGGPDNPLGARALYLGNTLYRIHGTNEAHTIGRAVSSGCIRMMNEDVIDLYQRVDIGTKVVVY